jgi:hypothetical protein
MEEEILDLRHSSEMAPQILSGWDGVKVMSKYRRD